MQKTILENSNRFEKITECRYHNSQHIHVKKNGCHASKFWEKKIKCIFYVEFCLLITEKMHTIEIAFSKSSML